MEYSLRTENVVLSVPDRKLLNEKLGKLDKFVRTPYVADVALIHTSHANSPVTCIINIEQGKHVFHAQREGNTIQTSTLGVVEALEKEIKKQRGKQRVQERVRN